MTTHHLIIQCLDRSLGHDAPTVHDVKAVADTDTEIEVLLDEQDADFAFGFDFPQKVVMSIGGKSYTITFDGNDWKVGDTKMDATSVQSVVARIRDLEGTRFAATGFGKPAVDITRAEWDSVIKVHLKGTFTKENTFEFYRAVFLPIMLHPRWSKQLIFGTFNYRAIAA